MKVDKERIRRAVLSMLARAVHSMEKGVLRLTASRERTDDDSMGFLKVEIIDPGQEIPQVIWQHIVQVFNRSESIVGDGTFGGTGLGLGLAVCKGVT